MKLFSSKCLRALSLVLLLMQLAVPALRAAEPPAEKTAAARITVINIALFYAGLIGAVIGASTGWVTILLMPRMEAPKTTPANPPPAAAPTP